MTAAAAGTVHFIVPGGIDDPHRTSGGNVFDRRLAAGLAGTGWEVRMIEADAAPEVEAALALLPAGAVVVIDGLVARRAPAVIEAAREDLRIVVLAHMVSAAFPDADPQEVEGERRALRAARCVIATSEWTRSELQTRAGVRSARIVVATPGTADAAVAGGTATGAALLCVGVVAPHKGQDVLVEALATLDAELPWVCTIAGSLTTCPEFADGVSARASALGDRVRLPGVLSEHELDDAYARTDLLVAPSRVESYGMAIADALRRGIPVVASTAGGIPQTVAASAAAVLVPPDDPAELHRALHRWMVDPGLRDRLRGAALRARSALPRWRDTSERVAATLARLP